MAYANSMTKLIKKIERRLGTKLLNLPEEIDKSTWSEVIIEETLETFSRFYPYQLFYRVYPKKSKVKNREGYYYIDEDLVATDLTIYGIIDLDFPSLSSVGPSFDAAGGYAQVPYTNTYGFDEISMIQAAADMNSLVNTGIYVEYVHPHMVSLKGSGDIKFADSMDYFDMKLCVKHYDNLTTISPTKMETFEELAVIDIKNYLYQSLKLFGNIETVFGNVDIKIDDWADAEDERKELVEYLREHYVSADNNAQPIMYTV